MKRNEDGTINWADQTVAEEISRGRQRQEEQQLSPSERAMLARARERERQRQAKRQARYQAEKERRADYLMDPAAIAWAADAANQLGCSASQLVEFAIHYLAGAIESGTIDLESYLSPTPQLSRFSQRLIYPQESKLTLLKGGNYTVQKTNTTQYIQHSGKDRITQ